MTILSYIKPSIVCIGLLGSPLLFAQEAMPQMVYPKDVQAVVAHADSCQQFTSKFSELPLADQARSEQEIIRRCRGLDKQLAEIKEKYQNNPQIVQKISEYDEVFYFVHWLQISGLM